MRGNRNETQASMPRRSSRDILLLCVLFATAGSNVMTVQNVWKTSELLESIVHRLHNTCRFNGAVAPRECDRIYSVLEHTTIGMHLLALRGASKEVRLGWACHDMHEAFIGDMITPLKNDPMLDPAWSKIERDEIFRVCEALGVNPRLVFQPEVKAMDLEMVSAELYVVALVTDHDKPFVFEEHGQAADMISTGHMWGMDRFWNEWKWLNASCM